MIHCFFFPIDPASNASAFNMPGFDLVVPESKAIVSSSSVTPLNESQMGLSFCFVYLATNHSYKNKNKKETDFLSGEVRLDY